MGVLPRPLPLRKNTAGPHWLPCTHPCQAGYPAIMGLQGQRRILHQGSLDSYRCFKLVKCDTLSQVISDTVEFRHTYQTTPTPLPEDKIINGLQVMASALANAPKPTSITQLEAIKQLRDLFGACQEQGSPGTARQARRVPQPPRVVPQQPPRVATLIQQQLPPPPTTPIPLPTPHKLNFDEVSPPRVVPPQQNAIPAQRPPRSPIVPGPGLYEL